MNNSYILRYMRPEDIQPVLEIDKLSFPLPWSARSYTFEISENNASHMIVVETAPQLAGAKGLRGVFQRLSGHTTPPVIAGYGGFWLIEGEAHVSTIAVHPAYRGQGLGEVLLSGMLGRGIDLDAEYSVLEVRVSNENAINLYKKYEYEVVGRRKNYYRDNNEDAYLMNVAPLDEPYQSRFIERLNKLHNRVPFTDVLGQDARR